MNQPTKNKLQIVKAIEAAAKILDAAEGDDELAGIEDIPLTENESEEPSLARFLDTVVFLETYELAKLTPDSPLWQQGLALTKLTQPEFLVDAASYLEPLFSLRGFGKYKLKWKALARPATTKGRFQQRGTFLRKFIGELAAKPQVFRDTFPETRLLQVARQLANVSAATTAPEALAILGSLRSVGGMSRLRAWNREAVKASGVEVDPFDDTVASVGEVRDLGKQIADTETQLQDPSNSTEAQDLQAKRSDLRAKLDEAVQQSPNPDVALAVAALAAQPQAYRTKVGELLKMNPVQETAMMRRGKVIIAAGAGSGKCVRGDTYVTTAKGVRRIVDCSGTHAVVSVDADKLVVAPAEGTWLDMGTSQTYKITTSSGLEVVVTPEHPLLVWNGQATWKQAQHMEAGDVVLLLPGHALEVGVRKVSQDEAYLLGLWMGNGWLSKSPYRVCWSSSNSQIVDHYKDLAEKFWGVRPETYVGADKTPGHDISRASVVSYLEKLGIAPIEGETTTSARTKEIPEWLMGASAGERVSFLRGLFDTDGTASGSTFEWLSASEMLARQVHQMLLGLGVVGRLKPKAVDGYDHTYWRILVGGDQLRALQTLVGFRHDKQKQAVLDAICDKDCNPNVGVYPHVGNLLKQVRTEWKAQGRWDGHGSALNEQGLWPSVKDYLSEKRSPSKERLQKLVSTCTGEAANLLRNLTAFYPDEVVSIVKNGTERVYDYNVPTTHSFIANGIVSHNTRVLAGKVVYHINEEGVTADSVLATSFTRKSAGELKDRIIEAGGGIIEKGSADDGFGTTHSIAGKLLRRFRPDIPRRKSIGGKDGHSQNMLYKLAIAQVKMRPQSVASQPDPNESFFSPSAIAETMKTTLAPEPSMLPAGGAGGQGAADAVSFADSVDQGIAWLSQPGSVQMLKDSIPWVRDWVASGKSAPSWMALFQRLKSGVMPRENMERKDRDRFMEVMRAARIGFVPGVSASVFPTPSVAAAPVYFSVVKAAGKAKEYSQYDKTPANQWFNQGEKIAELQRQAAMSQDKNNPASEQLANFTPGNVGRAITRWKGGLIPPGKAYAESEGSLEAAAYAAYEWIKNNDPIYIGSGDADDLLINFSKLAVSDASFREALQRRFKVVLIDECFTGDTPILLDTSGQTRTIQDLVENKYSGMVASYDEATGQTVQRQVVGWHRLACKGGTVRVIVQRKGYGKDGMPLADLTSRVRYGRHIVECTPDHRFYVEGQWVAAKDLKPGTKVILESDAPRDDSYNARHKIGPQGRAALGQLMTEKNEAGTCGTNAHGGTITQRGGNGRGPTAHEQALVERLGAGWVISHVVATGRKSPYPHHYKIDVAHPKRMLAIEVDGGSHQSPERQAQDRKKEALLTEHGWRVLRIKNKELAQMSDELIHERLSPCPVEAVVVAVEPGASTDPFVYDITVDQTHCYYAHGVLVHNCQDQNPAQYLMFGLITGYYDPATQQPRTDGVMTADTYAMIGDDKQCLEVSSRISTPSGDKLLKNLKVGDEVLSYRNGTIVPQTLRHIVPSTWTWGYEVKTKSGQRLVMSANHKLWASSPRRRTDEEVMVYLMYRQDMGFRVGITAKDGKDRGEDYLTSFGGRAYLEKAERMWILDICPNREDALFAESSFSLEYGVPTCVFNGETRGLNQARIDSVFQKYGRNGAKILEARHLNFDLPHWISQGYTKHGRDRHIIQVLAHSASGTQVSIEWSDQDFSKTVTSLGLSPSIQGSVFVEGADGHCRLRRYFANYREGLTFANQLAKGTEASISEKISTSEGSLRYLTASGLFVGMELMKMDDAGGLFRDEIVSINKVDGQFFDVDVTDASNLFAEQLLVSNSIYEFRGAEPTIFIDNSDSMGGPFKTDYLDTNYRSGKQIVDTAMNVISYNSHQIPMSCKPFPPRGQGAVHIVAAGVGQDAYMAAAAMVAEQVKTGVADGDNYKDYGVGCRTNKEAFSFASALLSGGIPFRSKYNPLTHWSTQALINWVVLADADENNKTLIDDLVVKCLAAPSFEVSQKTLKDRLQQMAAEPQNKGKTYLQILAVGGWNKVYLDRNDRPTSRNQEKVKPFLDALLLGKSLTGSPTDVIVRILNEIKGADGVSMAGSLALKEADRESDDTDEEEVGDAANESEEAKNARLKEAALSPLQPIIETARNYGDLSSFIGYLRELARVNDKVFHNDGLPEVQEKVLNAVNIDTVHGWKGLEVKNMYVPMAAGTFPFFKGNIESERRLAYVAITRGEDSVTVFDIKRKVKDQLVTSQFIQEMICGKAPASVEVPVTSARAFANATRALEAVAQLMAAELAEPAPAAPAEPEEFPPAPEDILMTEAGDEGSEDDQADESGGQAALARSQALMARLKR